MEAAARARFSQLCAALAHGAADPGSPWRNVVLATAAVGGGARARVLVLRGFDAAAREVELHSDARSAKMAELAADGRAEMMAWNPGARMQLRLRGPVARHHLDAVAREAWAGLREGTRATYAQGDAPGAVPGGAPPLGEAHAFGMFVVLRLRFDAAEVVTLEPNSRAVFAWDAGGAAGGRMVAP